MTKNLNLNYDGFENYLVKKAPLFDGIQYLFKFDNGYGGSVVKHYGSYGSNEDLWELAVVKYTDLDNVDQFVLVYDTGITDDVEGYLTDEDVVNLLSQIRDLS